jgi:pantoate--beta-alanine ligase
VATVVAKLFEIVGPDVAVFGQKDAQQALVIREMVRQLNMPVALRLARIAREPDGLARSSRNAYLAPAARARAAGIYAALRHGAGRLEAGERDPAALVASVRAFLEAQGAGNVEYAEVLAAEDLSPLDAIAGRVILAVAVHLDGTRLIDNMVFDVGDGSVETDVDLF